MNAHIFCGDGGSGGGGGRIEMCNKQLGIYPQTTRRHERWLRCITFFFAKLKWVEVNFLRNYEKLWTTVSRSQISLKTLFLSVFFSCVRALCVCVFKVAYCGLVFPLHAKNLLSFNVRRTMITATTTILMRMMMVKRGQTHTDHSSL